MRRSIVRFSQLILLATALAFFSGALPAMAATTKTKAATAPAPVKDSSDQITHSYNADPSVQIGMIVALKPKDTTTVIPLEDDKIDTLLGIVIPQANASIVITPQNIAKQQVLVATSGRYNVIVSNQNGPIKVGDYLTISAIKGIGMKADQDQEQVIGKAAGNFSGTANVISTAKLKDSSGKEVSITVSRIPMDINISHNPLFSKTVDYVPGFLAQVAVSVANKPVSVARIYLSMAILFMVSVITGNVLYSGVRSGMIAVGRNPLSKKSIIKSLIQTIIAGLIIFIAGVFAVYLLLKL